MLFPQTKRDVAVLPLPPSSRPQRAPARWWLRRFMVLVVLLLAGAFTLATRLPFLSTSCSWRASLSSIAHLQASYQGSLAAPSLHLSSQPTTSSVESSAAIQTALSEPARTTQAERTGLLFQALSGGKPLPSDWAEWLVPHTRPAQIQALERLVQLGRTTPADARLYRLHPIAWANQHARHGLTLLSDSGLESDELVRVLDRLSVAYTPLRMDIDPALLDVLRHIPGVKSTPTLFAGISPLGGLDTVLSLEKAGVLQEILHATDAF